MHIGLCEGRHEITQNNGEEDADRSRRVEFVVVTDAETRLSTILQELN